MKFQKISQNVKFGKNVKLHGFVNLYGCSIDDNSKIGAFVEIQKGAVIGKSCKISSHTFICEGVTIKDRVFVGHNVSFINDKFPQATNSKGEMKIEEDWKVVPSLVEDEASIGSGAVILCGIRVGRRAVVGAGSVVTKDIPEGEIWVGNPARFLRHVT